MNDLMTERAAGALANLAADEKCSLEIASVGGVHALVTLAHTSNMAGIQKQACRAIANLAAHGDKNDSNAAIGQEDGALGTLVQLTQSPCEGVWQEGAGALWNLSFKETNREAIAAAGGVEALVVKVSTSKTGKHGHAKCHFVALDIFTGKKLEDIVPSSHNCERN